MALFHDTADDYVPFFHSQDDYDAIQKRHANATATKPSGNHFSTAESYTLEAFAFISQH